MTSKVQWNAARLWTMLRVAANHAGHALPYALPCN